MYQRMKSKAVSVSVLPEDPFWTTQKCQPASPPSARLGGTQRLHAGTVTSQGVRSHRGCFPAVREPRVPCQFSNTGVGEEGSVSTTKCMQLQKEECEEDLELVCRTGLM